jgi:hypothetical protein
LFSQGVLRHRLVQLARSGPAFPSIVTFAPVMVEVAYGSVRGCDQVGEPCRSLDVRRWIGSSGVLQWELEEELQPVLLVPLLTDVLETEAAHGGE